MLFSAIVSSKITAVIMEDLGNWMAQESKFIMALFCLIERKSWKIIRKILALAVSFIEGQVFMRMKAISM